jgi:DNA-binding LytR/AlgR family response regulator
MPGRDGVELAHRLRALRPELPLVLYTSLGGGAVDPVFAAVLAKPVKQSQLFDLLATLLPRMPVPITSSRMARLFSHEVDQGLLADEELVLEGGTGRLMDRITINPRQCGGRPCVRREKDKERQRHP